MGLEDWVNFFTINSQFGKTSFLIDHVSDRVGFKTQGSKNKSKENKGNKSSHQINIYVTLFQIVLQCFKSYVEKYEIVRQPITVFIMAQLKPYQLIYILLMGGFTQEELKQIQEQNRLSVDQIATLRRVSSQYSQSTTKQQILVAFKRFGFISKLLEQDFDRRYGAKKEKPILISYDLLPNGKVQNFEVKETDEQ